MMAPHPAQQRCSLCWLSRCWYLLLVQSKGSFGAGEDKAELPACALPLAVSSRCPSRPRGEDQPGVISGAATRVPAHLRPRGHPAPRSGRPGLASVPAARSHGALSAWIDPRGRRARSCRRRCLWPERGGRWGGAEPGRAGAGAGRGAELRGCPRAGGSAEKWLALKASKRTEKSLWLVRTGAVTALIKVLLGKTNSNLK